MENEYFGTLKEKSLIEPFAELLDMSAVDVGPGRATVRMAARKSHLNIFGAVHGGVIFSLIDEAFQLACNSHGEVSVALNVSITYTAPADPDQMLEAKARELHKTRRTASYFCEVREVEDGRLIATAQALAYRTGKSPKFPGDKDKE